MHQYYAIFFAIVYGLSISLFASHYSEDLSIIDIELCAECEPFTTVAGCVNVQSGRFFQIEHDFIGNTIDPLRLTRIFDSGSQMESFLGMGVGSQFALLATEGQASAKHVYALISARDGFLVPYRRGKDDDSFKVDPRLFQKGYTNTNGSEMSGQTNFINHCANFNSNPTWQWEVRLGDGTIRIYEKFKDSISKSLRKEMGFPTEDIFLLKEERKPNGNKLVFDYEAKEIKPRLAKVSTLNRLGLCINQLLIEYSPLDDVCVAKSSCGQIMSYVQPCLECSFSEFSGNKRILQSSNTTKNGRIEYGISNEKGTRPRIELVKKPDGRSLQIKYHSKAGHSVEVLVEPLGENGQPVPTYHFQYEKDYTRVYDGHLHCSDYHFDSNKRLSRIDFYEHNQIVKQNVFEWHAESEREGWLKFKSIQVGPKIYQLQKYDYDVKGNVTRKIIFGNITGEKPEHFSFNDRYAIDSFCIDHLYSNDDRNLISAKIFPQGLKIGYDYLPGTNLCTRELRYHDNMIYERILREYDHNAQITTIIEDDHNDPLNLDVTGVTYRRIKNIKSEENIHAASYGKPKNIFEYCLDKNTGQVVYLNRKDLFYDEQAREIGQKIYDSNDRFCYETTKTYDSKGRIIRKSNPLGHVTRYAYDENNNLIEEELIGSGKTLKYQYDLGNRKVCKQEFRDGQIFTTNYTYDVLSQLISEKDVLDNLTTYQYDRFGRQTLCKKPFLEGLADCPTITKKYNILDHVESETDENGLTTRYTYNIFGQPTRITYPDGSTERFIYCINSFLKRHYKTDNTFIQYEYDPQGRVIKETVFDAQSQFLKDQEYKYKGSLLIWKKDSMDVVTRFEYDGAGRKIAEICGTKIDRYEYDDFGRMIKVCHVLNDIQAQEEVYQYDWLDRIVSKTLQNSNGTVFAREAYEYDINDNCVQKTIWQSEEEQALYRNSYDADSKILWKEDPLKNRKSWAYRYHESNSIGQRVLSRTLTDPLGREENEMDNSLGLTAKREVFDDKQICSRMTFKYDPSGKIIQQHVNVMSNGQSLREYSVVNTYNSRGLVESETEQPGGKTTHYAYDSMNRLVTKQSSNDVELNYTYDSLGRLKTLSSNDQTVSYSYEYDRHDNLVQIYDHIHHTNQKRAYDVYNRLIQEEITLGVIIKYSYDNLDRVTQMILPDASSIVYTYDACLLRKIQRFDAQQNLSYECHCEDYDMRGNLLKQVSPAGVTSRIYDLLGRNTGIKTSVWEENLSQFDATGNLKEVTLTDSNGKNIQNYAYDRFDHLIQEKEGQYEYDSLGNVIRKSGKSFNVDSLNRVVHDGDFDYVYDQNGNLIKDSTCEYRYDALNRLISHASNDGDKTSFIYDAFNRCLSITSASGSKQLIYQNNQDIGCVSNGKIEELRVLDPKNLETTFAIELYGKVYFPIQDHGYNIRGLQDDTGSLLQTYKYTAFGSTFGALTLDNPWKFGNRRSVAGLVLFAHRFYNPRLMRWLTPDPIGFEDGLNLYTYNRNNPFKFRDPDGKAVFLFALPITLAFGVGELVVTVTAVEVLCAAVAAVAGYVVYNTTQELDAALNPNTKADEDKRKADREEFKRKNGNKGDRIDPKNLEEQLALEEARAGAGKSTGMRIDDPKYANGDWDKMEHVRKNEKGETKIDIHYWKNKVTGESHGFKFKNNP